jgi:hypothetical protein
MWLIQEDTLFNRSELLTLNSHGVDDEVSFRIRQLFPLVTLWFQQVDEAGAFANNWTNTSGWLQNESECHWFGITCDENGSVSAIAFNDCDANTTNNYVGSIPPDIALLTSLLLFSCNPTMIPVQFLNSSANVVKLLSRQVGST